MTSSTGSGAQAYADYHDIMDLTEELVRNAALQVAGSLQLQYQGEDLDFGPPFRRASMHDLVRDVTGACLSNSWNTVKLVRQNKPNHLTRGNSYARTPRILHMAAVRRAAIALLQMLCSALWEVDVIMAAHEGSETLSVFPAIGSLRHIVVHSIV